MIFKCCCVTGCVFFLQASCAPRSNSKCMACSILQCAVVAVTVTRAQQSPGIRSGSGSHRVRSSPARETTCAQQDYYTRAFQQCERGIDTIFTAPWPSVVLQCQAQHQHQGGLRLALRCAAARLLASSNNSIDGCSGAAGILDAAVIRATAGTHSSRGSVVLLHA